MDTNDNAMDLQEEQHRVITELGDLPETTLLFESGLADLFGKHPISIKRAVERGELPPSTRLMGRPVWTKRVLVQHIEERLRLEAEKKTHVEKVLDLHMNKR